MATTRIVSALCLGMYVSDEVANELCQWLTECLRSSKPRSEIQKKWDEFYDEPDTPAEGTAWFDERWEEALCAYSVEGATEIPNFYADAVEGGADRVLNFGEQYTETQYIVALLGEGTPTLREVKQAAGEPEDE